MLIALFIILMIVVFGRLLMLAIKASWGIFKILLSLVFLPLALIGMCFGGLVLLALIIAAIVGILSFIII